MVHDATMGYFIEKSKHENVMEAIRNCNGDFLNKGIRIINNQEFIVGEIKRNLVECDEGSKIFDINRLVDIR